jgi:hypothetical protein
MKNSIHPAAAKTNRQAANVRNEFKPVFTSVDLWNIHKMMIKTRVMGKCF